MTEQEQKIKLTPYTPAYLTGMCRSGSDSQGTLIHATRAYVDQYGDVQAPEWEPALCGKRPGRRSNGFSAVYGDKSLDRVTCPKCRKALEVMNTPISRRLS